VHLWARCCIPLLSVVLEFELKRVDGLQCFAEYRSAEKYMTVTYQGLVQRRDLGLLDIQQSCLTAKRSWPSGTPFMTYVGLIHKAFKKLPLTGHPLSPNVADSYGVVC
jgi:hypothetical protein